MKINELARLANVSKRTLHYYDEIGLLTPASNDKNGYRIYSDQNIDDLQQILFFRQLDMPLKQIKRIMHDPAYDEIEALHVHKQILLQKREKMETFIRTIDKTLRAKEGGDDMTNEEKFTGFDFADNRYEEEARKRYGNQTIDETKVKVDAAFTEEMNAIFRKLARLRSYDVEGDLVQKEIGKWYNHLNTIHRYSYDAFAVLAHLYTADERLTENIDQFGDGLASWIAEAMLVYVRNKQ